MSDPKEYEGYAFPAICDKNTPNGERYVFNEGMTLRDYFAASALQGVLSNPKYEPATYMGVTARLCYEQADAMIKARNS